MKRLSLAVLVAATLSACTPNLYPSKGNATVISSKPVSSEASELTVQRDNGEKVVITRKNHGYVTVGSRVTLADKIENPENDLTHIKRYEFK